MRNKERKRERGKRDVRERRHQVTGSSAKNSQVVNERVFSYEVVVASPGFHDPLYSKIFLWFAFFQVFDLSKRKKDQETANWNIFDRYLKRNLNKKNLWSLILKNENQQL